MNPQMPSTPELFFTAVQAWQVPAQAESQQTPSTQKPEAHCAPDVHAFAEQPLDRAYF